MGMGIKCRNQRVNTSWSSPRITERNREREREKREERIWVAGSDRTICNRT